MKILALEPYYGGSHKAFLDGWISHSEHEWTVLGLPAYKWKWRMRHSGITLAKQANTLADTGESWDMIFCSDMLNLPEFLGFARESIRKLPSVIYFHENQLTYPVRKSDERDMHFGFTNILSAAAATEVWFNSDFHKNDFLNAAGKMLSRMPDGLPPALCEEIANKCSVKYPGIDASECEITDSALHIIWAARWEHDKNPEAFFEAMYKLSENGMDFKLSVLGESFADSPKIFNEAKEKLARHIQHFGWVESKGEYLQVLREADIFVSTAAHEFFGIAAVEACACGCYPVLPERLAYPEVFNAEDNPEFFYDGIVEGLVRKLTSLINTTDNNSISAAKRKAQTLSGKFKWAKITNEHDDAIMTISKYFP